MVVAGLSARIASRNVARRRANKEKFRILLQRSNNNLPSRASDGTGRKLRRAVKSLRNNASSVEENALWQNVNVKVRTDAHVLDLDAWYVRLTTKRCLEQMECTNLLAGDGATATNLNANIHWATIGELVLARVLDDCTIGSTIQ